MKRILRDPILCATKYIMQGFLNSSSLIPPATKHIRLSSSPNQAKGQARALRTTRVPRTIPANMHFNENKVVAFS